ncbi:MAG TPA: dihydropteroate synthase [Candidatus Acidoferrales bacterium]|jgi:dihydropteroate synthase|nr:dihydropteroate synthase [Candidatus Acidoferrales bacterium]
MIRRKKFTLRLPSRKLVLGERTLIMGVLNVTPDSFSDGGQFLDARSAVEHAFQMERDGADLLDIGGESTRPGSRGVSAQQELDRILPVLNQLRGRLKIPISIDTQKAEVAEAAAKAGAEIINDISALRSDPELAKIARRHRLPMILMHMRGAPRTMQQGPFARNVLRDVTRGLREALARARRFGIVKSQIILDPGIGFGKSYAQNFELLARLPELARLGYPLLVGASRKAFIGHTLGGAAAEQRIWGTAATVTASILGGAHIVRVHDVAEMAQVVKIADSIANAARKKS